MLQGTFSTDTDGLNEVSACSEMQSSIKALQIPLSDNTGGKVPTMDTDMIVEESYKIFSKTREFTVPSHSVIHYGHCIAARGRDALASVNLIFMITPFKLGKLLSGWTNMLYCMIQNLQVPCIASYVLRSYRKLILTRC